jgi:hypothetical protein
VPKTAPKPSILTSKWPKALVVLVVGVGVFAGAYYGHYHLSQFYLDYARLSENYTQISLEYAQLSKNYSQLKDEYLSTITPTIISPPISKLTAINVALTHGGWNTTKLEGLLVNAKLCYVELMDTPKEQYFHLVYEVIVPVADYSPVNIGEVTYRYVWYVIVSRQGFMKTIPPQGSYLVDVATHEVITFPFDMDNPIFNN